jgi:Flp pilus assembly pilin Flp
MRDLRSFIMEEDGMGTVEIVLIIVVLVGLVVVFKNGMNGIINSVITAIKGKAGTVADVTIN